MADQALPLQVLSDFAQTLVRRYQIADVLYELADRITGVPGISGAGVSLGEADGIRCVTASTKP